MGRMVKRRHRSEGWKERLNALFPESRTPLSEQILAEARWVSDCFDEGYLFKLADDDLEEISEGGGILHWEEKYGELVWMLMEGNTGGSLGFLRKAGLIADIRKADAKASKWAFAFNRVVRMYDTFSRAAYSKPLTKLVQEAKAGKDASLFKLIQIDKGILSSPWVAARVSAAQLRREQAFFDGLAEVLERPTFSFHQNRQIALAFFLYLTWNDLQLLRNEEILALLKETPLWGFNEPTDLGRFINRLGLKKAGQKPESDKGEAYASQRKRHGKEGSDIKM